MLEMGNTKMTGPIYISVMPTGYSYRANAKAQRILKVLRKRIRTKHMT